MGSAISPFDPSLITSTDTLSSAMDDLKKYIEELQELLRNVPQEPVAPKAKIKHKKIIKQSVPDIWQKKIEIVTKNRHVFIATARLSHDANKLATLSEDGKCELYWVPTGKRLYTLGSAGETFAAVDFIDDNTLIACEHTHVDYGIQDRICLFGYRSNTCEKIIIANDVIPRVKRALYNRYSKKLLILTYDKKFYSVDAMQENHARGIATGIFLMATDCTSGYSVTFSYSDEYKITVWDNQNQFVKEIVSDEMITALAINRQINKIAAATNSYTILLWDIDTGKETITLASEKLQPGKVRGEVAKVAEGHSGTIESLDFNDDGTLLISASHDQTARVWDLKTDTSQMIHKSPGSLMRYVQFNCTRDRALIINQHAVSIWNRIPSSEQ